MSRHRGKSLNPTSAPSLPPPSVQMPLVVFPTDCKSHTSRGRRRCLFLNVRHALQCKSAADQGGRVHLQDPRRGAGSGALRGLPGGQRRGTWSVLLCDTGHVLSVLPWFQGAQARPEKKGVQPFASAPSLPPSRGGFGSRAWRGRGGGGKLLRPVQGHGDHLFSGDDRKGWWMPTVTRGSESEQKHQRKRFQWDNVNPW